jgi:hypothetical protein
VARYSNPDIKEKPGNGRDLQFAASGSRVKRGCEMPSDGQVPRAEPVKDDQRPFLKPRMSFPPLRK